MSRLVDFWSSKENQKKYGFTYEKDAFGINSIYYDGDINELLEVAYKASGYTTVEDTSKADDYRPILEIAIDENGNLVMKNTRTEIEVDIDGEGKEPNFYIRFVYNEEETIIRFNMISPELYPNNEAYPYRFSLNSLSAINTLFENRCEEFAARWKAFHPDDDFDLSRIPNYRAINRL